MYEFITTNNQVHTKSLSILELEYNDLAFHLGTRFYTEILCIICIK